MEQNSSEPRSNSNSNLSTLPPEIDRMLDQRFSDLLELEELVMDTLDMSEARLRKQRTILKHQILRERAIGSRGLRCPTCGERIEDNCDMHEVMFTRGMVQKMDLEDRLRIHSAENCVLVHPGECHQQAATEEGKRKCVRQILEFEGFTRVMKFLEEIRDNMTGGCREQVLLVHAIFYAIQMGPSEVEGSPPTRPWTFP